MPLYEYECDACSERYELIRKFSDPPLEACPKCGKGPVRKLVSSPAFHLKGSGWYKTDYAPKASDSDKSGDKASKGETADSTDRSDGTDKANKTDKGDGKTDKGDKSAPSGAAKSDAPAPSADKPAAASPASPGKPERT